MTLAEISAHVTQTVGQTDATSVAVCKDYVKRNYQIVWDSHDWRDARVHESLSFTAGDGLENLPAAVDRVIAVKLDTNNALLDPVDAADVLAYDASVLNSTGTPTMYEELTTSAGVHQLRLYPAPATNSTVTVVGKRVRPELTDGTSPILRNIDNILIAFTMANMLERQRQYAKANQQVEKGGALLEAAKRVEMEQSNRPRRAKSLTASGDTLAEMADDVCARIGDFRPETYILVKQFLRREFVSLWDARLWNDSRVAVNVASNGEQLILPEYIDRVIGVRADPGLGQLGQMDAEYVLSVYPTIFEETTGTQFGFSYLTSVGVKTLPVPDVGEKLAIRSTSASDATGNVFVYGEDSGGLEVRENVALNGTTPVLTTNTYKTPLTITKPANTAGDIIVMGNTSAVELQRIYAGERERKHLRLWLFPPNTASETCLVVGKRRLLPLVNDQDTPLLRGAVTYLVNAATANAFMQFGKQAEAQVYQNKADEAKQTLISLEEQQGAKQMRVIPSVEPYSCDDSWFLAKR